MHVFDRTFYDKRLSGAIGESDRRNALACRWEAVKTAAAHCKMHERTNISAFLWSLHVWQRSTIDWGLPSILETDDCTTDHTVESHPDHVIPLIHILGDLDATLVVSGYCEIVIGGNIQSGARIRGAGSVDILVGGHAAGCLLNADISRIWIGGDLTGEVVTGNPATIVHVMGDYSGVIKPMAEAACLELEVRGFMSKESLEKIASYNYTGFDAMVGSSDQPVGRSHPSRGYYQRVNGRSSFQEWVVQASKSGPNNIMDEV
jgi:hypothetical protein